MGPMRAAKQVGASDFNILIHMTTLLERLVASEPVQRALDRMEDAKTRGGIDGMIAATARRVKAMNTPEKLRAMEIAVESFITSDEDGLTMQQVRQLRQIAQDARTKINESRVREFVRLVVEVGTRRRTITSKSSVAVMHVPDDGNWDQGTLTLPSGKVEQIYDRWADDFKRMLRGVKQIEVTGAGWAFDANTGEPHIPPGTYDVKQFIDMHRKWEEMDPDAVIDELDDNEDDGEELDEFSGCAGVSGYTAPLGANPSGSTPKKRATWK